MPYVIGTAGHIDHGKTSLVKALTGQDTDRLKEEKERGISIDLGFAHLQLEDGTEAGVVDVPGHERFIRNMLAGAHGMDLVLFTIAADDGVMPQTEEHLDIVHLLGVSKAIVVITKADMAAPERIEEVRRDIEVLVAGTTIEGSPVVPVSVVTEEGLPQLREEISRTLHDWCKPRPAGQFRLPVDRVFLLQGHGVIVTGTAISGEIAVGDRLRSLPGGQLLRVRSVQVHGRSRQTATSGERVALNLAGEERAAIVRGDVLCDERLSLVTNRFDASVEVRPAAGRPLKNHQRVRVHIGTAERLGKVVVLGDRTQVAPRQSGYCQITLSEPVAALRGDRFIIRDETAQRTIGGGTVLHPRPRMHKKRDGQVTERLGMLERDSTADAARMLIDDSEEFALPAAHLAELLNVRDSAVRAALQHAADVRVVKLEGDQLYTSAAKWTRVRDDLVAALGAFHAASPLATGMEMEAARHALTTPLEAPLFRAVIENLEGERVLVREQSVLRLPSHQVRVSSAEQTLIQRIRDLLSAEPFAPPVVKQLEDSLRVARPKLAEVLRLMERDRTVVRIAPDLYFLTPSIEAARSKLRAHLVQRGTIGAAAFRDLVGTSRKYAIPLLEYFDREGLTVRVGDDRRLKAPKAAADQR